MVPFVATQIMCVPAVGSRPFSTEFTGGPLMKDSCAVCAGVSAGGGVHVNCARTLPVQDTRDESASEEEERCLFVCALLMFWMHPGWAWVSFFAPGAGGGKSVGRAPVPWCGMAYEIRVTRGGERKRVGVGCRLRGGEVWSVGVSLPFV